MADSCAQYVSTDDLKAAKESILHIEHVATSKDANGNPALVVTDPIRGVDYTNTTLDGLFSDIGFKPVNGSFEDGGTLLNRWDVLLYETNGAFYQWMGDIPSGGLVVSPGSSPFDSSGNLLPGWVDRTDLTLRSDISDPEGATTHPELQMARWRDQGDVRGWGGDINAAIVANRIMRKTTRIPAGTHISGVITVYDWTYLQGEGIDCTFLKPSVALSGFFIIGENSNSLWGTQSLGGVRGVVIENLTVDGDKTNSPNASGIGIYGWNTRISNVKITQTGGLGLRTEWADSGNPQGGMEGKFENITIENSGEHGWRFAGPHDSNVSDVIIISSGQKTAGTYDGLYLERGNARWRGVHVWTSATDLRSRYALHIAQAAQGNEFSLSHFEGANKNVLIDGNNNILDSTCKVYYPYNQDNIIVNGSNVRLECYIGEEYKGIGLPLATGITFGGTFGGPSGCIIDCTINGCEAGAMYFGASNGYNTIRVRGYSTAPTTIAYGGTPLNTDMVDLVITGGARTVFKQNLNYERVLVGSIAATGSTQTDAAVLDDTYNIRQINGGASGAGVKLPNATSVRTGFKITLANTTGVTIKVYPFAGGNILGLGANNPLSLAGLQSAEFIVNDGSAGTWLVLKGS